MCSGCSGNYEDSDYPEAEDVAGDSTAAGGERDGSGGGTTGGEYEVLVSEERIVEVRTMPSTLWSVTQLWELSEEVEWEQSLADRKHSSSPSAKYYRAKVRNGGLQKAPRAQLLKPRVLMGIVVVFAGLMGAWLFLG